MWGLAPRVIDASTLELSTILEPISATNDLLCQAGVYTRRRRYSLAPYSSLERTEPREWLPEKIAWSSPWESPNWALWSRLWRNSRRLTPG